ncbi:sugar-binding domain protein [Acetobacteraceae bacterium AT-5844]|nr:sugar-binding domain protein [Acetobacteraceae bacterium AT-5844]
MADVARQARVSKMTVSRVVAGHSVAEETRARVLAVIKALGYVIDPGASALSTGRSGFVAALVPTINNSNFADTARGLTDALMPAGLQLLLGFTEYDDGREEELVRAMLTRRPEAVVLTGGHHARATVAMLSEAGLPVIETWEQPRKPLGVSVGFSNAQAAAEMVRYLHGRGYRRIAFLAGESGLDRRGEERERGYRKAIAALGLGEARVFHHGRPPISMQQGCEGVEGLLREFPDSDAVLCVSDLSAFGAIMACQRLGRPVPESLAVAGFGDFEVSRVCNPRITTIGVDGYALGQRAGEALLQALAARRTGQSWPARRHIALPFGVIRRESA